MIILAEFCLECWNRMNETNDAPDKYIISEDLALCEECGKWKHVIIAERKYYYMRKLRFIVFPIKIIFTVLYVLWRLLILPYLIYKNEKSKNKDRYRK